MYVSFNYYTQSNEIFALGYTIYDFASLPGFKISQT